MMLASAQHEAASAQMGGEEWRHALYDPYPPGILPADLSSETARVEREVNFIFKEAIGQWHALPPPNEQGNPPTLQGSGYQAVEVLGKLLNFDQNMSPFKNEACGFCHMPYAGFSGPIPSVNLTMVAYPGSARNRANKRTAQRYPYAPDFPVLEYNPVQGLFFGGNFWDSRATTVSPPLTPTSIPLPVNAWPAVRHRPKVIRSSSPLRRCLPAHRRSVVSRRCRVQNQFHEHSMLNGERWSSMASLSWLGRLANCEMRDARAVNALRGVNMNKVLLTLSILLLSGSLLAQVSPTTPKAARVQISRGPEIELASEYLTIIRWTVNKPRTTYHYTVDSMEANGRSDGVASPINNFRTP